MLWRGAIVSYIFAVTLPLVITGVDQYKRCLSSKQVALARSGKVGQAHAISGKVRQAPASSARLG